jgi:uncharacterized RDD family membrane protein YckC
MQCGAQQDSLATHCVKCGQPLTSSNPYASPTAVMPGSSPFQTNFSVVNMELAGRLERFCAQMIDGFLNLLAALPGGILIVVAVINAEQQNQDEPGPLFFVGAALAMIGLLALNIYQWVLIARDGQSIGKRLMKVRIIKVDTRQPPGFVHGVLLRLWVNSILAGLPCGLGLVYSIVDLCFIFREDRRCVHDLLAQTVVVSAPDGSIAYSQPS